MENDFGVQVRVGITEGNVGGQIDEGWDGITDSDIEGTDPRGDQSE